MIKNIEFIDYRNLNGKYNFNKNINMLFGKNNTGKTNLLDGIRLAFSAITQDYFKINKSDFKDSDDSKIIEIKVELDKDSIPSLNYYENDTIIKCGFKLTIRKTQSGRYVREVTHYNGTNIDYEILREDPNLPNLYMIPLVRIDDIFTNDLTTNISTFLNSEEKYLELKNNSRDAIKIEMKDKIEAFQNFCSKFEQNLNIEISDPKITDEKVYIVNDDNSGMEHSYKIGSGYKSIANIILNTMSEKYNIILIDEIENHLHPSLIRTLIRMLREIKNITIVATTHSSVVINELNLDEILDVCGNSLDKLKDFNKKKLDIFLNPGRSELMMADNIIMVEGYTEEILLNYYLYNNNRNWTIVNVAGVMFEPYIDLAKILRKRIVVISDNDISNSDEKQKSSRFINLEKLCLDEKVKLIEINNTLETDLYENGFLENYSSLLKRHKKHEDIIIAKDGKKTEIALSLIGDKIDLSTWHVVRELEDEFESN